MQTTDHDKLLTLGMGELSPGLARDRWLSDQRAAIYSGHHA